jgi:hypothetical protein
MEHKMTLNLERSIFKELKKLAAEDGVSPAEAACGIIEDFIEERSNPLDESH